jgi:hypothetical protein
MLTAPVDVSRGWGLEAKRRRLQPLFGAGGDFELLVLFPRDDACHCPSLPVPQPEALIEPPLPEPLLKEPVDKQLREAQPETRADNAQLQELKRRDVETELASIRATKARLFENVDDTLEEVRADAARSRAALGSRAGPPRGALDWLFDRQLRDRAGASSASSSAAPPPVI